MTILHYCSVGILFLGLGNELEASSIKEAEIDLEEDSYICSYAHFPKPEKEDKVSKPYVSETLSQRHKEDDFNTIDGINRKRGEGLPYKETEKEEKEARNVTSDKVKNGTDKKLVIEEKTSQRHSSRKKKKVL